MTARAMEDGALTFRLLGRGIAYSASPAMMTAAFAELGLKHRYVIEDVEPDDVASAVERLREPDSGGANVTVPHKAVVAGLVDELSEDAERAGAVNVVARDGRRLLGLNTDLPATVEAIRTIAPSGVAHAVVLGAGGAGRAAELALRDTAAGRVTILRRSDGSLTTIAQALATADLLVNATPVGTGADESPVDPALLRPDLAVLDLVYRPSPTRLVRDARAIGARAVAGAGILLGQAWRSLELWLSRPAPVETMRRALRAELGEGADV
jgi:shikimate dehydrogenase